LAAREVLAFAAGEDDRAVARVDTLPGLELGDQALRPATAALLAAAEDPEKSVNKQAMKLIKDKAAAKHGCQHLFPGGAPLILPGTRGVRAFVLGPPQDEDLIADEDPATAKASRRTRTRCLQTLTVRSRRPIYDNRVLTPQK
jgi:hypothetical protein